MGLLTAITNSPFFVGKITEAEAYEQLNGFAVDGTVFTLQFNIPIFRTFM